MNEKVERAETQPPFMAMTGRQLLQIGLLGIGVGLLVWGMAFLFENYVLKAIVCQGAMATKCGATSQYAEAVATIIAGGAGLFGLVRVRVFRPLLVVVASAVSMWGLVNIVTPLFPWYGVGIACALLYGFAYLAFAWLARIRVFWIAAILLLILVVGIRLLIMR